MAGPQDSFRTIGAEAVTFGTAAVTLTRGIEHEFGQEPTPNYEVRPSKGMRPSGVAQLHSRAVVIPRNGKVPIECDLWNKSHGLLLALVGSGDPVITTPGGGTLSRLHTITPTTTGPSRSITVHDEIIDDDGDTTAINYLGVMCETLKLSIAPKSNVKLHLDCDNASDDLAASTVTPSYASSPYTYKDTDTTITLGGTSTCAKALELNISTNIKTDLDRICSTGRRQPTTVGEVVCTGSITVDYDSTEATLAAWKAGTTKALTVYILGSIIEGSLPYFARFTVPSIRYTGSAATRQNGDITEQVLPFEVTWDGTNPPWKIEYQTTDTSA